MLIKKRYVIVNYKELLLRVLTSFNAFWTNGFAVSLKSADNFPYFALCIQWGDVQTIWTTVLPTTTTTISITRMAPGHRGYPKVVPVVVMTMAVWTIWGLRILFITLAPSAIQRSLPDLDVALVALSSKTNWILMSRLIFIVRCQPIRSRRGARWRRQQTAGNIIIKACIHAYIMCVNDYVIC